MAIQFDRTGRGFPLIEASHYPPDGTMVRIVQQSSAVGEYADAFENHGSSYLWVGDDAHLNREEVAFLRDALTHWLATGKLFLDGK